MLGYESGQRSFFDASLGAGHLLKPGSIYEMLYRFGHRLLRDEDFADCYDTTTGRPSVPPGRMFKLLLLQQAADISDREALERMAFDLRWKAVLGLEVGEGPVAQSTLSEFRARVQLYKKMEEAFGRFLERAVELGVIDPKQVQLLDSSGIWGRGAVLDSYNLIAAAVRKLLGAAARWRGKDREVLAAELGVVLSGSEDKSLKGRGAIDWTDAEARKQFLNEVVGEARQLLAMLKEDETAAPEIAEAVALLRRILVQDLEPTPSREEGAPPAKPPEDGEQAVLEIGQEVQIRKGVARDRIMSVGDPEMRHGHKSQNRHWDGYRAHVSVEAGNEFITAVHVTPANVGDAQAASELLAAHRAQGLSPEIAVGDMAYSAADLRVQAAAQGTEIVARVPPAGHTAGCFGKEAFSIDLEAGRVSCPAGEVTQRAVEHANGSRTYAFDGTVCAACPLRTQCTRIDPERMRSSGRGRTITVHAREDVLQAARAAQSTPRVQELLQLRPMVERGIAHLMRGLRQARYVGVPKVQFQALAKALVVNLVRLGSLLQAEPAPQEHALAA